MLSDLPVLGICGSSGSGKTTLLETLARRLSAVGLSVALVKHDVHGIDVDRPGKDSDRLFQAGADVLLQGPTQEFFRLHGTGDHKLTKVLTRLSTQYDVVLLEGHKGTPVTKLWLLDADQGHPPGDVQDIAAVLPKTEDRPALALSFIERWLPIQWMKAPLFACVLIGGKSSRMGVPKHLLQKDGKSWLERTVDLVRRVARTVVVVGGGRLPPPMNDATRLPDAPDAGGPIAGILAAMRWAPLASWLVVACDLPNLSCEALCWLLSARKPGVWAVLPMIENNERPEPLLAHYDFRARGLLEELVSQGDFCPAHILRSAKVISPSPPAHLAPAWTNVNAIRDLRHCT